MQSLSTSFTLLRTNRSLLLFKYFFWVRRSNDQIMYTSIFVVRSEEGFFWHGLFLDAIRSNCTKLNNSTNTFFERATACFAPLHPFICIWSTDELWRLLWRLPMSEARSMHQASSYGAKYQSGAKQWKYETLFRERSDTSRCQTMNHIIEATITKARYLAYDLRAFF